MQLSMPRGAFMIPRNPVRIARGVPASDGGGVRLTRLMGGGTNLPSIDPFLMLDHFDSPKAQDYLAGFPDHPHRGFETVTYMLDGRIRHKDNHGHEGVIESGGVQWMTAGRGVVHSEMPEQERGPIATEATDARYFDVTLPEGATFDEPLAADLAAFVVVFEGAVRFDDGKTLDKVGIAELGSGDAVRFTATGGEARALVIAGKPLREPVEWYGPFVMNTREEIMQAVSDYQAG